MLKVNLRVKQYCRRLDAAAEKNFRVHGNLTCETNMHTTEQQIKESSEPVFNIYGWHWQERPKAFEKKFVDPKNGKELWVMFYLGDRIEYRYETLTKHQLSGGLTYLSHNHWERLSKQELEETLAGCNAFFNNYAKQLLRDEITKDMEPKWTPKKVISSCAF